MVVVAVGVALTSCTPGSAQRDATTMLSVSTSLAGATSSSTSTIFAPGIRDAEDYLFEAIAYADSTALFREKIDWVERRSMARDVAAIATHPFHLHEFIRTMLADLNDNHSHLVGPATADDQRNTPQPANLTFHVLNDRIGQVSIGAYGSPTDQSETYVDELQSGIATLSQRGVCGWIVDLRTNTGGNMWPMIAGVGPLLEPIDHSEGDRLPGTLGHFVDPDGHAVAWRYANGVAYLGDEEIIKTMSPATIDVADLPVAVIISGHTASAGEYVLMSFLERPNTRTFGFPTFGATSANDQLVLSDGAAMLVAVASAASRAGTIHDPLSPIHPDELGEGTRPALAWLLGQEPCRG